MDSHYNIEEINCYYSTIKLCIGQIVDCRAQCNFGIVYKYDGVGDSSVCRVGRLYYFFKEKDLEIPPKAIVSFIEDVSKSRNRTFEVSHVNKLSDFEVYILSNEKEKSDFNETSSTDTMAHMMKTAKKFMVIDKDEEDGGIWSRLYFPIINIERQVISYYYFTSGFSDSPRSIFDCFAFTQAYEQPRFPMIRQSVDKILDYVDSLDSATIQNYFTVTDGGYFQSRPGKDDHFIFTKNRLCSSNDSYLNQLTKLWSEVTAYDCCQGRDDEDFCNTNFAETESLRDEIKQTYDKSNHALFLISDYLNSIKKDQVRMEFALDTLTDPPIRKGDEYVFNQNFSSLEQWMRFISSHKGL